MKPFEAGAGSWNSDSPTYRQGGFFSFWRRVGAGVCVRLRSFLRRHSQLPQAALVCALTFICGTAPAEPQGGRVAGGEGSIQTGKDTVVEQTSRDLVVDWDRFDVGKEESVHFKQQSAAHSVLNRIYDHKPSEILGRITARGRVWLLNPRGVFFGRGARVSVGSLVAAGLWMEKEDFLAGRYVLSRRGETAGAVRNAGLLEASAGGIGLAGGEVVNEGKILARQGRVTLAAGERMAVDFDGDGLLRFALTEGAAGAAVRNDGTVEGGAVALGLQEAVGVFRGVVNNGGAVQAVAVEERGGAVSLVGQQVNHTGRIAAQSGERDGGMENATQGATVELQGERIGHDGEIEVSGAVGGTALLEARDTLEVSGSTLARGETGAGGDIRLLAERVNVRAGAQADASGATDGGAVRVGGGWQGLERGIRNAWETMVERGVSLRADGGAGAGGRGDGGTVVVWSDGTTRFAGRISARGGLWGGNGGRAEVSGREHLYMRGLADLRAPWGRAGTLLLDPGLVYLCHEGTSGCDTSDDTDGPDRFSDTQLATMLGTASVTVATSAATTRTTPPEAAFEDIVASSDFDLSWTTANTLTLEAGRDILLDGSINGGTTGILALNFGRNLDFGGASLTAASVSATVATTGTQTITGPSDGSNWRVTGSGTGSLTVPAVGSGTQSVLFSGVEDLQGGSGYDRFTIEDGASIGVLSGGGGVDTFSLAGGAAATNVDGGGDTDFLFIGGGGTWTLAATENTYVRGTLMLPFSNIEELAGGGGQDIFNVNAMHTGNLWGGGGDNIFRLNSGGSVRGGIAGGEGNDIFDFNGGNVYLGILGGMGLRGRELDTLDFTDLAQGVQVSLSDLSSAARGYSGGVRGGGLNPFAFDGIDEIRGSAMATDDGLTGLYSAAGGTFRMDAMSRLTSYVTGSGATEQVLRLSGMDNMVAGVADVLDFSAATEGVRVSLSGVAMDGSYSGSSSSGESGVTASFSGIREIRGSMGADSLTGRNVEALWTAGPTGSYESADSNGVLHTLIFHGIEALYGGSMADTFAVPGLPSRTEDFRGGGGADTFILGALQRNISFAPSANFFFGSDLSLVLLSDGFWNIAFSNISDSGVVIGIDGGLGADTFGVFGYGDLARASIRGGDGDDSFLVGTPYDGAALLGGEGADTFLLGTVSDRIGGSFNDGAVFGLLDGGDGDDTFTLERGAAYSGVLGGEGMDTLDFTGRVDYEGGQQGVQVTLSASLAGLGYAGGARLPGSLFGRSLVFSGIDEIRSSATATDDGLTAILNAAGGSFRRDTASRLTAYVTGSGVTEQELRLVGIDSTSVNTGGVLDLSAFSQDLNVGLSDSTGLSSDPSLGFDCGLGECYAGEVTDGVGTTIASFDNIVEILGGMGTDSLADSLLFATEGSWTVIGPATGSYFNRRDLTRSSLIFYGIENLQGSTREDTFTVVAPHTGNLRGGGGPDVFNISAALTGSLSGEGGADIFNLNAGGSVSAGIFGGTEGDRVVLNMGGSVSGGVTGGMGADTFDFNGGSVTGTVAGGADADTFTISAAVTGTFLEGSALLGGAGADIFVLNAGGSVGSYSLLAGGLGADTFDFNGGTVTAGVLDGGAGADVLDFVSLPTAVGLTLRGTPDADGFIGAVAGGATVNVFAGIDEVRGSTAATDRTTGLGTGGAFQGSSTNPAGYAFGGRSLALSGFESTSLAATDVLDLSSQPQAPQVRLSGVAADGYSGSWNVAGGTPTVFTGIREIRGLGAGDRLTGRDADAAWTLGLGAEDGFYSSDDSGGMAQTLFFSGFDELGGGTGADGFTVINAYRGVLEGGSGADGFVVEGALTGALHGDAGDDYFYMGQGILGLSPGGISVSGNIVGGAGDDYFEFDGGTVAGLADGGADADIFDFEEYFVRGVASLVNGGTGTDQLLTPVTRGVGVTLRGEPDADGFYGEMVADGIAAYFAGIDDIAASNDLVTGLGAGGSFQGSATDPTGYTFGGRSLTLNGFASTSSAATDVLDLSSQIGDLRVSLSGIGADGYSGSWSVAGGTSTAFTGVREIRGAMGAGDRLTGRDADAAWSGLGEDAGLYFSDDSSDMTHTLFFFEFDDLRGGTGADTFAVNDDYTVDLRGGGGPDVFHLNAALTGSLLGEGGADTFRLNEGSSVSGGISGGMGADTFDFNGGSVMGTLAGDGGADVLDFATLATAVSVSLSGTPDADGFDGSVAGGATVSAFSGIGDLRGSAAATDSLTGLGAGGAFQGMVTNPTGYTFGGRTLALSGFEDALSSARSLLDLSAQTQDLLVLLSGAGADGYSGSWRVMGGTATAFTDVQEIRGGMGTGDRLTGRDADAAWTLGATGGSYASEDSGGMMRTLAFSSFEDLRGGTAVDRFVVSGAYAGDLHGGSGADVFTVAAALTGALRGDAGTDTFTLNSGGSVSAGIFGGTEGDRVTLNTGGSVSGGISGDAGADTFAFNGGTVTGTVAGGAGADVLDFADLTTAVSVTLSGTPAADGFGGSVAGGATVGAFSGIGELAGGTGTDRLTGLNAGATWTLAASNSYESGGRTLAFGGLEDLQGGTASDEFAVSASHAGDLQGGGGADEFTLTAALTGSLSGDAGVDMFTLNAGGSVSGGISGGSDADRVALNAGGSVSGGITGGMGADTFAFNGGTVTGTLAGDGGADVLDFAGLTTAVSVTLSGTPAADGFGGGVSGGATVGAFSGIGELAGGTGTDSLTGLNTAATWTLAASDSYAIGGRTLAFGGLEDLQGGTGADEFAVSASHAGDLSGGGGADEFTLGAALTGSLVGEGGADTFTLNSGGSVSGDISGGTGADTFDFNGGTVTGTVAGGGGADILDFAGLTTAVSVTLSGTPTTDGFGGAVAGGATVSTFSGVGEVSGGTGTDSLTGLNTAAIWTLAASDSYASGGRTLAFGGLEDLQGGTGADEFTVSGAHTGILSGGGGADEFTLTAALTGSLSGEGGADTFTLNSGGSVSGGMTGGMGVDTFDFNGGSVTGTVAGGGGADILDFAGLTTAVSVTLSGTPTADGFGGGVSGGATVSAFSGIGEIRGSTMAATDRVAGLGTGGAFQGMVTNPTGYTFGGHTLALSGFEDAIFSARSLLDLSAQTQDLLVLLIGAGADGYSGNWRVTGGMATAFTDVQEIRGGMGTGDRLTGRDADATWTLGATGGSYASDDGGMMRTLAFSSFEDLRGGTMVDRFAVSGAYAGDLHGGGGADVFTVTAALTGALRGDAGTDTFTLNSGGSVSAGVFGGTEGDRVTLNTGGSVSGGISGDAGADTFAFNGGTVTGTVAGGTDADILDFADLTTAVTVTLSGTPDADGFGGSVAGGATVGAFSGIGELAGGTGTDRLTGLNAGATWTLVASSSYESGGRMLAFGGLEDLQGGTGADEFAVSASHTGDLQGGGGADVFTLGAALTGSLSGEGGADTFTLNSGGSVSGGITGGMGVDTFDFNGGSVTGTVAGGGSADVLDFAGLTTAVSVTLSGTPDADGFGGSVSGGATVSAFSGIGELAGGSGTDSLSGLDAVATWTLAASDRYESGGRTLAFGGLEDLQGGTGADEFTVSASHTGSFSGGGGMDTFTLGAALTGSLMGEGGADEFNLNAGGSVSGAIRGGADADTFYLNAAYSANTLEGGAGDDRFVVGAAGDAASLDGGADADTLQGRDVAAAWTVGATSVGYAAGGMMQTLPAFSGIEVLRGGALADAFTVSGARSLVLEGGGGADTFTLNSGGSVSGVSGGMGADTFDFDGGSVTGTVSGGAGADLLDFAGLTAAVTVTLSGAPDADGFGGSVSGGATVGAFSGIGELAGGAGTDRLSGLNARATWTLAAADRYESSGRTLAFGGLEDLQGGTAADEFTVGAMHTGDLSGGGGADMFTVSAALTGSLSGEGGADTFALNAGGSVSGVISGGMGADTFRLEGDYGSNSLQGDAGADRFLVGASGRAQLLDGGADADTLEFPEGGAGFSRAVLLTPTLGRVYAFQDGTALGRYVESFEGFERLSSPDRDTYLFARPDTPGADLEIASSELADSLSSHEGESLSLPNLDGFAGAVFLGGMIPEAVPETDLPRIADPALASAADGSGVETGRLRIAGAVWAPGRLVLLAREVVLGGDLAAGASSSDLRRAAGSGSELSIFAVGGSGQAGDIAPAPEGERRSLYAGNALLVAAGRFLQSGSMVIDLGPSGQLRLAQGASGAPEFHPQSRFFGGSLGVAAQDAVAALGLSGSVQEFSDLVSQPAIVAEIFLPIDRASGPSGQGGLGSATLVENLERIDATPEPLLAEQDPGDAPGAAVPEGSLVVEPVMVVLVSDRVLLEPEGLRRLTGEVERTFEGLQQLERAGGSAAVTLDSDARFLRYQQAIGQYFKRLSSLFIDPSLFEEGIQLFTTVGKGLALYLSQCEEWEGCAPPLELEELDGLIAKVERALSSASSDQAPQYQRVLQDYRKLREEYIDYLGAEEDDELAARGAVEASRAVPRVALAPSSPRRR